MIAIVDNGRSYSDHSLWFVECDRKGLETLIETMPLSRMFDAPSVTGWAERITWRKDGDNMTMDFAFTCAVGDWIDDDELEGLGATVLAAVVTYCSGDLLATALRVIGKRGAK